MAVYKNVEKSLLFKRYIETLTKKTHNITLTMSSSFMEENSRHFREAEMFTLDRLKSGGIPQSEVSSHNREKAREFRKKAKNSELILIDEEIMDDRVSKMFFNLTKKKHAERYIKWTDEELSLDIPFDNVWLERVGKTSEPLLIMSYSDEPMFGFPPIYNTLWGVHIFRDETNPQICQLNFLVGQTVREPVDFIIEKYGSITLERYDELGPLYSILSYTTYEADTLSKVSLYGEILEKSLLSESIPPELHSLIGEMLGEQLAEIGYSYSQNPDEAVQYASAFNSLLNGNFFEFYIFILLKIYSQKVSVKGSSNKPVSFLIGKKNRFTNNYIYVRDKKTYSYQSENLGQKMNWDFHFKVQGHWRHFWKKGMKEILSKSAFTDGIVPEEYLDMNRIGTTYDGKPVKGKTWVSDFTKGDLTKPEKKQTRIRKNPEEDQYNIITRRWLK